MELVWMEGGARRNLCQLVNDSQLITLGIRQLIKECDQSESRGAEFTSQKKDPTNGRAQYQFCLLISPPIRSRPMRA